MLYNWYYTVNRLMFSSSEASTSIKAYSSLASYSPLSVISRAWRGGFWRQHTYEKHARWAARVQESEILKHQKKGIYRKLPCVLNP